MERINDNMLTTASILFITALLALIMIQRIKAPAYTISIDQTHNSMISPRALMLPDELHEKIVNGTIMNYTLIDLRENFTEKIPVDSKIIEIPFNKLHDKSELKKLSVNDSMLLIADKESVALMAMQILISNGFPNTVAAANDADFIIQNVFSNYHPRYAKKHSAKAGFDYNRFMKSTGAPKKLQPTPSLIPTTPDATLKSPGGC
jgi:hypothetical protein